jgi:serine/threonine-protein kinase
MATDDQLAKTNLTPSTGPEQAHSASSGQAPTYVQGSRQNQIPTLMPEANMAPTVVTHPAPASAKAAPPPNPSTGSGPQGIPDVEIECELGRGGMGVVYRGRQTYIDRRVAVKLLPAELAARDQRYISRFQREAKLMAGLSHPNIVACFSAGVTSDNCCYLVMEYIDGPNLATYLAKNGALSEAETLGIIRDMANALEHARRSGIIHRDVKAENILLQRREGSDAKFPYMAKLADLGLARPTASEGDMRLTQPGSVLGSPASMAPEQYDDPDHVDHRADIYGLGCVMFQAVTGKLAFSGTSLAALLKQKVADPVPDPRDITKSTSFDFSQLTRELLQADKDKRLGSYDQLIARCDKILGNPAPGRGFPKWPLIAAGAAFVAMICLLPLLPQRSLKKSPARAQTPFRQVSLTNRTQLLSGSFFRTPAAMFQADGVHYLAGWEITGSWGPGEDTTDVLVGHAPPKRTSSIRRTFNAPWKLQGVLRFDQQQPKDWRGTFNVELGNGAPLELTIQDLGDKRLFRIGSDYSEGYTEQHLRFTVIALHGVVCVILDDKEFATLEVPAPPSGIGFTVTEGLISVETLELKKQP